MLDYETQVLVGFLRRPLLAVAAKWRETVVGDRLVVSIEMKSGTRFRITVQTLHVNQGDETYDRKKTT